MVFHSAAKVLIICSLGSRSDFAKCPGKFTQNSSTHPSYNLFHCGNAFHQAGFHGDRSWFLLFLRDIIFLLDIWTPRIGDLVQMIFLEWIGWFLGSKCRFSGRPTGVGNGCLGCLTCGPGNDSSDNGSNLAAFRLTSQISYCDPCQHGQTLPHPGWPKNLLVCVDRPFTNRGKPWVERIRRDGLCCSPTPGKANSGFVFSRGRAGG